MKQPSRNHYVAYHNADQRNSHLSIRDGSGVFETNKATLPTPGDVLWCFEGEGRPKRYQLVIRGIVARTRKRHTKSTLVYFDGPSDFPSFDVTLLPWFDKLARSQGSFSFGLNAIRDPDMIAVLERFTADEAAKSHDRDVFKIRYRNEMAKGWIDFYPLQLLAVKKSGPILYRCQHHKQRLIARARLDFGEGYADLVTDREESTRLDIYPGTLRLFLKDSRSTINISEVQWADPGGKFEALEPSPTISLVKTEELEKQREIDRLDRVAKHRPEQVKFRSELLSIYSGTCAVTGCSIAEALQAAHLKTIKGKDNNDPSNGILLRSDIHDLFDAGLFSLSKDGLRIEASQLLTDAYYLSFDQAPVFRPSSFAPLQKYIESHRQTFGFRS